MLRLRLPAIICVLLTVSGCAATGRHDPDLPNFHQVTPALFRGAQPSSSGVERLHAMGVRTIVNVRTSDDDREAAEALGMRSEQRGMSPWSPRDEHVLWFLDIATDPEAQPVFVHCEHGADRTGYLIAMYRVVVEGWDRERAIDEMTAHGMGFHDIYQGLISYVRKADVQRLRQELEAKVVGR